MAPSATPACVEFGPTGSGSFGLRHHLDSFRRRSQQARSACRPDISLKAARRTLKQRLATEVSNHPLLPRHVICEIHLQHDAVAFEFGGERTAEEIAQRHPSIPLADVYQAIGCGLRHSAELEPYLALESLLSLFESAISPEVVLRAVRQLPHPSAAAVDDLDAAIAAARLPVRDRGAFDTWPSV